MMPGVLGGGWKDVAVPDAAFSYVPFTIQQKGRVFRPATSFNLQTYAGISVAKTYYVDNAATGTGTGADWTNAFTSLVTAMTQADVDRIYVKTGTYRSTTGWSNPARSMEVIAVGGPVILDNNIGAWCGAFTAQDAHYISTVGGSKTAAQILDGLNTDAFGDYTFLTLKTSAAEVDATPGSWWQTGTTLHVNTIDSRAPDANIHITMAGWGCTINADNITVYAEGISFYGGQRAAYIQNNSVAGGLKAYFKNCQFKYSGETAYNGIGVLGASEFILQNCLVSKNPTGDGINYHVKNGVATNAIEIDCEVRNSGDGAADQASTAHDGSSIVRINGKYHDVAGQCIADVGPTPGKFWLLGSELYNSTSGIGYYAAGSAWLDSCYSHGNATYDLVNEAGITTYIRNFIGAKGVNNIVGTLTPY